MRSILRNNHIDSRRENDCSQDKAGHGQNLFGVINGPAAKEAEQREHSDGGNVDPASNKNHLEHIHPNDLHCPFNLSRLELQAWRRWRAADRAAGLCE